MPPDRDELLDELLYVRVDENVCYVRVDENVCIGIGVCVESEPETFLLGDDGVAHVLPGKALPRDRAEQVCRGCPSGAISIVDVKGAPVADEEPR